MNASSLISCINESNSSTYLFHNDTEVETDFQMYSVGYIISILLSFPINSYVIWLILRGTGNGLVAEFFIFNTSASDIILCIESLLILLSNKFQILWIGVSFLDGLFTTGHSLFDCLICFERYLAVVHPVTFLKYKPLRYRLMCSVVAWVAAFASGGFTAFIILFYIDLQVITWLPQFLFFLSIQLFCCLAVLRALKQSGPGERGREREEENHMKRRAFHLILITTVATVIIHATMFLLAFLPTLENEVKMCVGLLCFTLAGLVQPVLFLYRVK